MSPFFVSLVTILFTTISWGSIAPIDVVPKPLPGDRPIGEYVQPKIELGDKVLAHVPLLISAAGKFALWMKSGTIGYIFGLEGNGETGELFVEGKPVDLKHPVVMPLLKSMAWFLIQRYPEKEYSSKFLQFYFKLAMPNEMDRRDLAKFEPVTSVLGLGALNDVGDTREQLESFFEDPTEWKEGVCTKQGDKQVCLVVHEPEGSEESLGEMVATTGIKKLMVHEEELANAPTDPKAAPPKGQPQPAATKPAAVGYVTTNSQAEFEADFAKSNEQVAYVVFCAELCGPCRRLRDALNGRTKHAPAGSKVYMVHVDSYDFNTLPPHLQTFKGAKGFPQVISFTKDASGKLSRSSFAPGETGVFQ